MKAIRALPTVTLLTALAFFLWVATRVSAAAQEPAAANCAGFAEAASGLEKGWGEALIGRGLMPTGTILTLFTDAAGDSWTALLVSPDGRACIVASGTGWEILAPPAPGVEG